MIWKNIRKTVMYSVMVGILFATLFQSELIDNVNSKQDQPEVIDPYVTSEGMVPTSEITMRINSEIHNYTEIGSWVGSGAVYNVIVDGNFAFVAAGSDGLRILNITDKTNPVQYGLYQNGTGILRDIKKVGTYLFLAYGSNGFEIIDTQLSMITPQFVANFREEFEKFGGGQHECYALDVEGNWTYVAAGEFGFAVFDTENPAQPIFRGKYQHIGVDIRDIDVYVNFAYIADINYGIRRVDIATNKVNPQDSGNGYRSTYSTGRGSFGIHVRSDYYAVVADYSGFLLLSLYSYPDFKLTREWHDGTHAKGAFSIGNTAFVIYSDNVGMRMFNITDKQTSKKFEGQVKNISIGNAIYVQDDYAYISDGSNGLKIILLDSDSDGLYDGYEIYDVFTDPYNPDTDGDTLLDGEEFYGYYAPENPYTSATQGYFRKLNPLNNDTDGDNITDDEEIFLGVDGYRTNPEESDSDGDGLNDWDEIYVYFTNPTMSDTDNDNLSDGDEVLIYGTNPLSSDTDGDGMPDHYEVIHGLNPLIDDSLLDFDGDGIINIREYDTYFTNPNKTDTDMDGLTDGEEVFGIYVPNHPFANATGYITTGKPLVPDSDSDGLKDGDEVLLYNTNPLDPDSDDDGLNDYAEVKIYFTDPNNPDTDGDGMGDKWEVDNGTDPLVDDADEDPDGDGLTNIEEMLLGTKPLLSDTDGDGMPDGWEVANGLDPKDNSDALLDNDLDGLTNRREYQLGTDPNNSDTDGDGMPDGWEVANGTDPLVDDADEDPDGDGLTNIEEMEHRTKPLDYDTDRDGLSDGEEVLIYGTNPLLKDTDGDGFSDYEEVLRGTDPLDPNSNPTQRNRVIYVTIGSIVATTILMVVIAFFIFYAVTRIDQKMFRYLEQLKNKGHDSVTIKEISNQLGKKLNRGEIKQIVNEYSEVKGYTIDENRVWFTNYKRIKNHIEEFNDLLKKSKVKLTDNEKKKIQAEIQKDMNFCDKLRFKDLRSELEELLDKIISQ